MLSALDPSAAFYASQVSGALYVELSEDSGDFLLLTRRELVETVLNWGLGIRTGASAPMNTTGCTPEHRLQLGRKSYMAAAGLGGELELDSAYFLRQQMLRLHETRRSQHLKDEAKRAGEDKSREKRIFGQHEP